ncbi:MAG: M6 family metalloprotease domain-containing protein [Tidjanibacter sp.]|nr:M6 family metalloprotease domain-containing protein [Tidjanibacter sp.]
MKKIILTALLAVCTLAAALAIPAKPGAVRFVQSDGSVISLETFGDEFSHYTLMDRTYTVVQKPGSTDFYFATQKDGVLTASGVLARPVSQLSAEERKVANRSVGLRPTLNSTIGRHPVCASDLVLSRSAEQTSRASVDQALKIGRWGGARKGKMKGLAILVEYSDVKFQSHATANADFTAMLNEQGYSKNGATGSARDYFIANSNGQFEPEFVVMGPYELSNPRSYYGGNTSNGSDQRPAYMILEACNLADREGLDFSQFDGNNDGQIDLVFVFFAGNNEAEAKYTFPDAVWPHMSYLIPKGTPGGSNLDTTETPVFDGKIAYTYACTSELKGAGKEYSGIGSFCHEFGHAIGLPDNYDTDGESNGTAFGLQYADIMAAGNYLNEGRTPPAYNIFERWLLGWASPKEITEAGEYRLGPLYDDHGFVIFTDENRDEFFLLENHNTQANAKAFKWDKYLLEGDSKVDVAGFGGGNGMLVYHVDIGTDVLPRWDANRGNAYSAHECLKLFRADPSAANSDSRRWFFPGDAQITSLTDKSTPAFVDWSAVPLGLKIANIALDGEDVVLTVLVDDLSYEVHQYDAFVNWETSKHDYAKWKVVYTDSKTSEQNTLETTDKFVVLPLLAPRTEYGVAIYGVDAAGVANENATYNFHITTQGGPAIISSARSALNMQASYGKNDYVWLSVKDLDCTPEDITWYIDGQKSESVYLKLSAGKHQVCAVVTDTEGNTEYIYRYITVK